MSSWDASSRPNWDPQDRDRQNGAGESTQAFGVPDFPDPGPASPGSPPDIFLQDYDQNEFAPNRPGHGDFPQNGFGRPAPGTPDPGPSDRADRGHREEDFGRQGNGGPQGSGGPQDGGRRGGGRRDNGRRDHGRHSGGLRESGRHGRTQEDALQRDLAQWNRPQDPRGYADSRGSADPRGNADPRGYADSLGRTDSRGTADPLGYTDQRGYGDRDQAARMDPALRDFFAPQPARPGSTQQGYSQQDYSQQGYGQQGYGQQRYAAPGSQGGPWGGDPDPFQPPDGPGLAPRPDGRDGPGGWDSPAPRPGSRSARRQESRSGRSGRSRRSGVTALVAAVVVVIVGVGAYVLLSHGNSGTPSSNAPTSSSSPNTNAATTPAAKAPAANTVAYTLTTPATAGGYPKLATIPAAVQTATGPVSQAIESAAKSAGGKVSGQVAAAYQLSGGQVLAFSGFKGTFSPAKIMASLASLATDSHTDPAGPHGGMLGCATTPDAPSGTVCLWATTTTLGITEFFSPDGPEVVTDQAKAAADTLKVRNSVEVPK